MLQRELRTALIARRIVIHYQPVIAFEDDRVIRFEARPRWNSNNQGWIERDQLIALAEDVGLITELDDQLLSQACLDSRTWPEQITLAVRLSPIHLRDPILGSSYPYYVVKYRGEPAPASTGIYRVRVGRTERGQPKSYEPAPSGRDKNRPG